jgi:hypothetical protein
LTGPSPFIFGESDEVRRHAPATARNRVAITSVLAHILPKQGTVLEIASGTGEHIVHFAQRFPNLHWQPSDYDRAGLDSIAAWRAETGLPNLLPPVQIDASSPAWPVYHADAILCINMVHISPWKATQGLFVGASCLMPPDAPLYLYGPYLEADEDTAKSNLAFDQSLRSRNPEWGLRDRDAVIALAQNNGCLPIISRLFSGFNQREHAVSMFLSAYKQVRHVNVFLVIDER